MSITDTHRAEVSHLSLQNCQSSGTIQYLLEKPCADVPSAVLPPVSADNTLRVIICGEKGFEAIAEDIHNAHKTIDIACWGFDPGMMLTRPSGTWNEKLTYGHLLEQAIERNVTVRLLVWHCYTGGIKMDNMPGHSGVMPQTTSKETMFLAAGGLPAAAGRIRDDDVTRHWDYNVEWFRRNLGRKDGKLRIVKRDGQTQAIVQSLRNEAHSPDGMEALLQEIWGTHHQKTILIDFEPPNRGIGYVKGLNSLTAYWDSAKHEIDNVCREVSTDSSDHARGFMHQKPYQDYACRIEGGGVLAQIHRNFASAWERAGGGMDKVLTNERIAPVGKAAIQAPSSAASPSSKGTGCPAPVRAQILRTQPEDQEKSIKAFYAHATTVAMHYLYVENQYFFYPEWVETLKKSRQQFVKRWNTSLPKTANPAVKGVVKPQDIPILHLFLVLPEPEDKGMIPRTYDSLRHLGQQDKMLGQTTQTQLNKRTQQIEEVDTGPVTGQDKAMEDYEDRWPQLQQQYDKDMVAYRQALSAYQRSPFLQAKSVPPVKPELANDVVRTAQAIPRINAEQLRKDCAMAVSTAMLYTHGLTRLGPQYRQIYIHSKLMMLDDACFTVGSANLSQRSMAADSEINIACDDPGTTAGLRAQVFGLHSGGTVSGGTGQQVVKTNFENWNKLMNANLKKRQGKVPLTGFLLPFKEVRVSESRHG